MADNINIDSLSEAEVDALLQSTPTKNNSNTDIDSLSEAEVDALLSQTNEQGTPTTTPPAPQVEEPGFSTGLVTGLSENLTGLALRGLGGEDLTQERDLPFEFGLNAPTAGFVAGQVADPVAALTSLIGGGAVAKGAQLANVGQKALRGARLVGQAAGPVAARFGVDPNVTPGEAGLEAATGLAIPAIGTAVGKGIAAAARPLRQGARIQRAAQKTDELIEAIGGGTVPDRTTAGGLLEEGFKQANRRVNDQLTASYDGILEATPGLHITLKNDLGTRQFLVNAAKQAGKLARRQSTDVKNTGRALLAEVTDVASALRSGSLSEVRDQMKILERKVFEGGAADPAVKEFRREAQNKLREIFAQSIKNIDSDLGNELLKSNKRISKFLKQGRRIRKVLNKDIAESKKFDQIFKLQSKEDVNFLLEEMLNPNPQLKAQLKAAFLDSIKPLDRTGAVDPAKFTKVLNDRRKRQIVERLFTEKELKPILEQAGIARRAGQFKRAVQIGAGISGAGAVGTIAGSRLFE